jgi:hypothetical protein
MSTSYFAPVATIPPLRIPPLPPIASFAPALFIVSKGAYVLELREVRSDGIDTDTYGRASQAFVARVSETFAGVSLSYESLPSARFWLGPDRHWDVDMPGFDGFSEETAALGEDWRGGKPLTDGTRSSVSAMAFQRAIAALGLV